MNTTRRRDQGADLAAPDVSATAELDAREASAACPGPDGLGSEVDVGGGEDLGGLAQRDPVGGSSHRRQSPLSVDEPDEPDEGAPSEPDEPELVEDPDVPLEPLEPDEPDEPELVEDPDVPLEPDESELVEDEPELPLEPPPSPEPVASPPLASFFSLDPDAAAAALVAAEPPRSFFAQPEPLKWIAGVVNCLRIVPPAPHEGQKCGPGSLMPWRMSAR